MTKIVLLTDSTGQWFFDTANKNRFFPKALYQRYGKSVTTRVNASYAAPSYSAVEWRWYGGEDSDTLALFANQVGGANWDDVDAAALQTCVTDVAPDVVMLAFGVNGGATGLDGLIDDVQAAVPSASVVLLSQNPVTADSGAATNRNIVQGYAASYGLPFIDLYQAFIDLGNWQAYLSDGTHPNNDGKQVAADVADSTLYASGLLGPEQEPPAVSALSGATLVLRANRYSGSGDWLDESGNSHDAAPTGSPSWDGEKFTLNGSGQFFTVLDHDDLDPGAGDFTVVVVATPAAGAGQDLITKRVGGAVPWWDIETNANNLDAFAGVSDGTAVVTVSNLNVIAAGTRSVFSSRIIRATDLIRITVDGVSANNTIAAVGAVNSTSNLVIGGTLNPDFAGDIYGVAIFKTSLSDAEVAAAGSALIASPTPNRMGGTGAIRKPPRYTP